MRLAARLSGVSLWSADVRNGAAGAPRAGGQPEAALGQGTSACLAHGRLLVLTERTQVVPGRPDGKCERLPEVVEVAIVGVGVQRPRGDVLQAGAQQPRADIPVRGAG